MKILLLLLSLLFVFTMCKKDSEDDKANLINFSASMTAKIDDSQWSSITRVTRKQNDNFIITGTGSLTGNNVIAITVFDVVEGTYNLDATNLTTQFTANFTPVVNNTDSIFQAYSGQVIISKIDLANKRISGTFNFEARHITDLTHNISVTEGAFTDLAYTE